MASRKLRILLGITLLILAAIIGMAGIATGRLPLPGDGQAEPPEFTAATALLDQARPLPAFQLIDDNGQPFNKQRLTGQWTLLFFGYTHCPDICPTTLATLDRAVQIMADHGDRDHTQVVFVSVDPKRDTPARLHDYVDYFNPRFTGVTGSAQAIDPLTSFLGIAHQQVPGKGKPDDYQVNHSASVLLIDPRGRLAAHFGPPHDATEIARDFGKLRTYYDHQQQGPRG